MNKTKGGAIMPRYTFQWDGSDVVIYTLPSNNYWRRVKWAKDAYHDGQAIVVIGSCNEVITFE